MIAKLPDLPQDYPVAEVCRLFDKTRQAYYKRRSAEARQAIREHLIIRQVQQMRRRQPMVGTRKLHKMLEDLGANTPFRIGRDQLFNLLRKNNMLIQKRKRYRRTTQSRHRLRVYENLIRDLAITRPEQVFVADITYIRLAHRFCYLALITDAYSRKIVGYDLSLSLSLEGSLRALRMALATVAFPEGLIHHSDRGLQYGSDAYVALLNDKHCKISMTEKDHVYENALAERVNGILKSELSLGETLPSFEHAQALVKEAIEIYNHERLHTSLGYVTPASKHAAETRYPLIHLYPQKKEEKEKRSKKEKEERKATTTTQSVNFF